MFVDITTQEEKLAALKKLSNEFRKSGVYVIVQDFIDKQDITSAEAIYQNDNVIRNAYEFIERLCVVVGYKEIEDEED